MYNVFDRRKPSQKYKNISLPVKHLNEKGERFFVSNAI